MRICDVREVGSTPRGVGSVCPRWFRVAIAVLGLGCIGLTFLAPERAQADTPTPMVTPTPITIGGGGSKTTDCLAVFVANANDPPDKPRRIRCTDGDPACDADGAINGSCEFPVAVCANSKICEGGTNAGATCSADSECPSGGCGPSCSLNGVASIFVYHAADNGEPKFDPEFQALQTRVNSDIELPSDFTNDCSNLTTFHVPVKGPIAGACKKNVKTIKVASTSEPIGGKIYTDRDKLKMTCDPAAPGCTAGANIGAPCGLDSECPGGACSPGCDPLAFYDGTFDRIQRQIFDQTCAVSGCHDSQSHQANQVLETGASYTNLYNVMPTNAAAALAGWKRVHVPDPQNQPDVGDPDSSLLFHKVNGPPDGSFGARMPLNRPKLDQSLIDVIQLWIAAGAPQTGWVAGTDQ